MMVGSWIKKAWYSNASINVFTIDAHKSQWLLLTAFVVITIAIKKRSPHRGPQRRTMDPLCQGSQWCIARWRYGHLLDLESPWTHLGQGGKITGAPWSLWLPVGLTSTPQEDPGNRNNNDKNDGNNGKRPINNQLVMQHNTIWGPENDGRLAIFRKLSLPILSWWSCPSMAYPNGFGFLAQHYHFADGLTVHLPNISQSTSPCEAMVAPSATFLRSQQPMFQQLKQLVLEMLSCYWEGHSNTWYIGRFLSFKKYNQYRYLLSI